MELVNRNERKRADEENDIDDRDEPPDGAYGPAD